MNISLEFMQPGNIPVDVRSIAFDIDSLKTTRNLERKVIRLGNQRVKLGEICQITRRSSKWNEICLNGNTAHLHHFGEGLSDAYIVIPGTIGRWAGAHMTGGKILIFGHAGDCLGMGMSGGIIRVDGDVGNDCGAAAPGHSRGMTGGMILVHRHAGDRLGAGMRRGLIVVNNNAGRFAGSGMIAGTILVGDSMGDCAGINMRRGSIVAGKLATIPAGFKPTGKVEIGWLRLMMKKLYNEDMILTPQWGDGYFHRYTGDHLALGKGEIILHEQLE